VVFIDYLLPDISEQYYKLFGIKEIMSDAITKSQHPIVLLKIPLSEIFQHHSGFPGIFQAIQQ